MGFLDDYKIGDMVQVTLNDISNINTYFKDDCDLTNYKFRVSDVAKRNIHLSSKHITRDYWTIVYSDIYEKKLVTLAKIHDLKFDIPDEVF